MRRACFAADITLQDARDAIHGRTEFREHPFADHVIFSYYLGQAADDAMFPDPDKAPSDALRRQWLVRRECRGLVFCSSTGALLSRRLHKFFNVGEVAGETSLECIDWRQPFVATEKLDGSMICPFVTGGVLRMATRMGVTDTSRACEAFLDANPQLPYRDFCAQWLAKGFSCIFEWCDINVPIVLRYPHSQLILVAVRHMGDGHYLSHAQMRDAVASCGIPVVKTMAVELGNDPAAVIDTLKAQEGVEGFVLRFESERWFKIKTAWYFTKNKAIDRFFRNAERWVWKLVLDNEYDDLKPLLPAETVARMQRFIAALMEAMAASAARLFALCDSHRALCDGDFAMQVIGALPKGSPESGLLYKIRRGALPSRDAVMEEVVATVRTAAGGSKRSFDGAQQFLCASLSLDDFQVRVRSAVAVDE